jgi:hypothetical protein
LAGAWAKTEPGINIIEMRRSALVIGIMMAAISLRVEAIEVGNARKHKGEVVYGR